LIRVTVAVIVLGTAGFVALAIALRQPTFTPLPDRGVHANRRALAAHVRFLTTKVLPRNSAHPENLERAAAYVAQHFRAAGAHVELQTFGARRRRYSNVIATFGPENPRAPLLVIGAHYDAFGEPAALPGADDNASGTAGLLEIARLLGRSKVRSPVMLVAFANEEPPFFGSDAMGSAFHARSLAQAKRNVRGMICLEMIGYFSREQSWPNRLFARIYPTRGDFIAIAGGWSDRTLAREVKRAMRDIDAVSFSGPRETSDASDHRSYWAQGWRAVMVTDTAFLRNPHYHAPSDTPDHIDVDALARIVGGLEIALRAAADAP
jgi:Zn-dependent M28 family amino/carboxypeptidase